MYNDTVQSSERKRVEEIIESFGSPTERDVQTFYPFEHRLIWLYTWRQPAKKGKPKK